MVNLHEAAKPRSESATQAGLLARRAEVRRLIPCHFSLRYQAGPIAFEEALTAFTSSPQDVRRQMRLSRVCADYHPTRTQHTKVKGVGRIEADFRLAAALVFLKGEADDPAVIERRADDALSEISGVNVSGE